MKGKIIAVTCFLSGLYLINPGLGVFEILPDNIPLVGNLDEGLAAFLFLSSLSYFGIDLKKIFGQFFERKTK